MQQSSYSVVKFMVNVRLMENRVKSHVGSVYETQKRMVGSTLRIERMTRPRTPKVDDGVLSAALRAAMDVWTASGTLEMAAAELLTSGVTASGAAMIDRALCDGGVTRTSSLS